MKITKDTKIADIIKTFPWMPEELVKISDKFKVLQTPIGKALVNSATLSQISDKTGIDIETVIKKIETLIENHK